MVQRVHKRPRTGTVTGRLWEAYDAYLAAGTGELKRHEAVKYAAERVPESALGTRKTQFQRWRKSPGVIGSLISRPVSNPVVPLSADAGNDWIEGLGSLEDFDPHVDAECPTGPGIYVFYDISNRPIYVGEGENVRKRIRSHDQKFWFKRPIVETASWIKIPEVKLRRQIEKLLIKFLKDNAVINQQNVERD